MKCLPKKTGCYKSIEAVAASMLMGLFSGQSSAEGLSLPALSGLSVSGYPAELRLGAPSKLDFRLGKDHQRLVPTLSGLGMKSEWSAFSSYRFSSSLSAYGSFKLIPNEERRTRSVEFALKNQYFFGNGHSVYGTLNASAANQGYLPYATRLASRDLSLSLGYGYELNSGLSLMADVTSRNYLNERSEEFGLKAPNRVTGRVGLSLKF